jgi:hypothetical protein
MVAMKVRLKVAREYTCTMYLRRDKGRFEESEDVSTRGAAGIAIGCQGIETLSDTVHELNIATKAAHIYTNISRIAWSPVSQCARNDL